MGTRDIADQLEVTKAELVKLERENAELRMALTDEARQLAESAVHMASAVGSLRFAMGAEMVNLGYAGLIERVKRAEAVIAETAAVTDRIDVYQYEAGSESVGKARAILATYQNGADQ